MVRKRKRAPGGGRKPDPNKKVLFTIRLEPHLLAELKAQAQEWQGGKGNVSAFTESLIDKGLRGRAEERRDPALHSLFVVIARLAEEITGGELIPDRHLRSRLQSEWRTDLFKFRAFKFAVKKLLDTLEEPPPSPLAEQLRMREAEVRAEAAANFGREAEAEGVANFGPILAQLSLDIESSPEAKGTWVFSNVWSRFTQFLVPLQKPKDMRDDPWLRAMDREYYDFQKARKALQLDPKWVEDQLAASKQHKGGETND